MRCVQLLSTPFAQQLAGGTSVILRSDDTDIVHAAIFAWERLKDKYRDVIVERRDGERISVRKLAHGAALLSPSGRVSDISVAAKALGDEYCAGIFGVGMEQVLKVLRNHRDQFKDVATNQNFVRRLITLVYWSAFPKARAALIKSVPGPADSDVTWQAFRQAVRLHGLLENIDERKALPAVATRVRGAAGCGEALECDGADEPDWRRPRNFQGPKVGIYVRLHGWS